MTNRLMILPLLLLPTSCGGEGSAEKPTAAPIAVATPATVSSGVVVNQTPPNSSVTSQGQNLASSSAGWSYGPVINGRNYSAGTSLQDESSGFSVHIPYPDVSAGTANYITRYHNGLAAAKSIYIDFEVVAEPGTILRPRDGSENPTLLTLYFQRSGDNWYADASTETFRWWASPKTVVNLEPGKRYKVRHGFDETWTAVLSSTSVIKHHEFSQARAYADRIGFTLGGGDGLGHGIYANNPARIVVHEFRVE